MIVQNTYNQGYVVREHYDVSSVETVRDLTKVGGVHGGNVFVLDMGAVDPSAPSPVSDEKIVSIYAPKLTSKIKDAKVLLLNGRMGKLPGDLVCNAGYSNTYTVPKSAGTSSAIATTECPKVSFETGYQLLIETLDPTDKEYQFLFLQMLALATADTWTATSSIDNVPYYLLDIALCHEAKDALSGPAGPAKSLYMNNTNTEVWVKWTDTIYGDSLQLIGCLDNAIELASTINMAKIQKGATKTTSSMAIDTREMNVKGKTYGFGTWLLNQMMKGSQESSTEFNKIIIDSGWKRIEGLEFFIRTHTDAGHDVYVWIPEGVITLDGTVTLGQPSNQMGFNIEILNKFEWWMTNDRWDHVYLALTGTVS